MANSVRIIVGTSVFAESDGVTVQNIRWSYDGPRTMTFTRDIRFDTETTINLNDVVVCTINNVTIFNGWIIDIKPSLEDNELVTYECGDSRVKLAKITLVKDGSASVIYNKSNNGPMTYGEIFYDIITISGLISSDIIANYSESEIKAMNVVSPEMSFTAVSVDEALRMITDKAGKFGFYITPNKTLKVVNLEALTSKVVYVGQVGEKVENHPEYDVWRANLNFSVAGCYTVVTIEGAKKKYQKTVDLSPDWDRSLDGYWQWGVSTWWSSSGTTPTQSQIDAAFRRYIFPLGDFEVGRIDSNTGATVEFSFPTSAGDIPNYGSGSSNKVWASADGTITEEYDSNRNLGYDSGGNRRKLTVFTFPSPMAGYVSNTSASSIPTVKYLIAEVRSYIIEYGAAFKITVGPAGTAYTKYGVVNELYIYDENFVWENVARDGESSARDDSKMMTDIANQLLKIYDGEQTTGTITLDTLRIDWDLGMSCNINNTSHAGWESLGATVMAVEINPAEETTMLTLSSSQYVGGAPDYEELRRRILIGQKIKTIESDIKDLQNKTQFLSTGDNTKSMNASGDNPESNPTWDATKIRQEIQNAMNENYFTMQKHDHTSATQGGDAFASKGGVLL